MSSCDSNDSSDESTLYEEDVLSEEVPSIMHYIKKHPKKCKPSRDQLVLGVVQPENRRKLKDTLDSMHSGLFKIFRSKVLATCLDRIDDIVYAERHNKKKLVLLVSPCVDEIKFDVPSSYKSLTVIRCPDSQDDDTYLSIDPSSRYCRTPVPMWDMRTKHLDHELRLESKVCLIDRFGNLSRNSSFYGSDFEAAIRSQADRLQDNRTSWDQRKMLVASILGGLVGGTTAVSLYSCVNITAKGVFLKCKGVEVGYAGFKALKIASLQFGAGSLKASAVATAQAVGPPLLIGAAAGLAVGALVYYVPWNSVFQWLKSLLNGIWNWLVEKFQAFCQTVSSWFKKKEHQRSTSRRGRSGSSHRHSTRMRY